MFNNISIGSKLLIFRLFAFLGGASVTDFLGHKNGVDGLSKFIYSGLTSIREAMPREVLHYFSNIGKSLVILASQRSTVEAAQTFPSTFEDLGEEPLTNSEQSLLENFYTSEFLRRLAQNAESKPRLPNLLPQTTSGGQSTKMEVRIANGIIRRLLNS